MSNSMGKGWRKIEESMRKGWGCIKGLENKAIVKERLKGEDDMQYGEIKIG